MSFLCQQWNNHGYRVASMFPKKFTWISPVWFQVKPGPSFSDTGEVSFDGLHDFDKNWTRKLQDAGVKGILVISDEECHLYCPSVVKFTWTYATLVYALASCSSSSLRGLEWKPDVYLA